MTAAAPRLDAPRHDASGLDAPRLDAQRPVTIAVAGNPNSGKSTLINAIAGSRLHVGNWPGVTVEKKEAAFEHQGRPVRLVDLPGTYSLSPWSQEEIVAREYLSRERPDVVIDVVDATNLERNLYLTVQLLELGLPVVVALNIHDEALAKGYRIDVPALEQRLGTRVIPTSATKRTGLDALLAAALQAAWRPAPAPARYTPEIEAAVAELSCGAGSAPLLPARWLALKLLEGDERVHAETGLDRDTLGGPALRRLEAAHPDLEATLTEARYALAGAWTQATLTKPTAPRRDLTDRIDRIVLNRVLGIPIFLAAMWLVFKLTFDLSAPFGDWIDAMAKGPFKRQAAALLGLVGAPDWTVSLVNDGIVSGVGFVLVFVPVIFAMMFFITFLEGSGYMARAAFVMDKAMHAIGLHGKSFIPMVLGFGCNVPGIYATRTLESQRDRVLTALLLPLMSCGARLPVYVLFAGVFFPRRAGTVIWSLYVIGIALAIGMGYVFKKTLFRGEAPAFILELPPYRLPSFSSLCVHTWEKGKHFLTKAGTYILAVSVLVWFLLNLPWGVQHKKDSYLGRTGQVIAPVLRPLGFGTWEAAAALVTGVVAKEIVVGTMGEIYAPKAAAQPDGPVPTLAEDLKEIATSFGDAAKTAVVNVGSTFLPSKLSLEERTAPTELDAALGRAFTPLTAFAFMVFVLLYMPCVVVAIAMRQEFGSWNWFTLAFAYQTALAWTVSLLVVQGGRALGFA